MTSKTSTARKEKGRKRFHLAGKMTRPRYVRSRPIEASKRARKMTSTEEEAS